MAINTSTILTITGSAQKDSSNRRLLEALAKLIPEQDFAFFDLRKLPVFSPDVQANSLPETVMDWKEALSKSNALIITTPAYLHNIPAGLKNALEWVTTSGEMNELPVLAITFTPHPPRGERAMQSLLWSLEALNAKVVAQLPLYQSEMKQNGTSFEWQDDIKMMMEEAVQLLL